MRTAIALIVLLIATPVWAEGWICISEQSAGFVHSKAANKWKATTFGTEDKFLIRRPKKTDLYKSTESVWVVTKFGEKFIRYTCKEEINKFGWLVCESGFGNFRFNSKTLRFLTSYWIGYVHAGRKEFPDAKSDSPNMDIGICAAN